MIKVFMVFVKCGFEGVYYFQHKNNANDFAKEKEENVIIDKNSS
jgi:hypothetical protein